MQVIVFLVFTAGFAVGDGDAVGVGVTTGEAFSAFTRIVGDE